jgi:hypothetical protein
VTNGIAKKGYLINFLKKVFVSTTSGFRNYKFPKWPSITL